MMMMMMTIMIMISMNDDDYGCGGNENGANFYTYLLNWIKKSKQRFYLFGRMHLLNTSITLVTHTYIVTHIIWSY